MGHVVVLESFFFFLILSFLRSFFQCLIGVRIAVTCHRWFVIENPRSLNHTLLLTPQLAGTVVLVHLLPLLLIATLPEWRALICAISLGKNMYYQKALGPAWLTLIPGLCLERLGFPWSIFGVCLFMAQNCRLLYQPTC